MAILSVRGAIRELSDFPQPYGIFQELRSFRSADLFGRLAAFLLSLNTKPRTF
jgi:hypothetical protein